MTNLTNTDLVYTCARPREERCKFFLWEDDAKIRLKMLEQANMQSEPQTPSKSRSQGGLMTPMTGSRFSNGIARDQQQSAGSPYKRLKDKNSSASGEETFDWDSDIEPHDGDLLDQPLKQPVFIPATQQKTPQAARLSSPGKRKLSEFEQDLSLEYIPAESATPGSSQIYRLSSISTQPLDVSSSPTPRRIAHTPPATQQSPEQKIDELPDLVSDSLSVLDRHNVVLPTPAKDELVAVLNRFSLRMKGIARGRQISRENSKKKDEEIKLLRRRIDGLKAERELHRVMMMDRQVEERGWSRCDPY